VILLLALVDFQLGPLRSGALLYLVPVAVVAWYGRGTAAGITTLIAAVASAGSWWLAGGSEMAAAAGSGTRDLLWNGSVHLVLFLILVALVRWIREAVVAQWAIAMSDPLTGLANAPAFFSRLTDEISRSLRYGRVFTLAYLDLDRFKEVNDTFGHAEGDDVLRQLAETMRSTMRGSDMTARLGGDEFGILLPETPYVEAEGALEKLRAKLDWTMRDRGWPVTLSIGAVTFESPAESADAAARIADGLMYAAKRDGGDRIRHLLWSGEDTLRTRVEPKTRG